VLALLVILEQMVLGAQAVTEVRLEISAELVMLVTPAITALLVTGERAVRRVTPAGSVTPATQATTVLRVTVVLVELRAIRVGRLEIQVTPEQTAQPELRVMLVLPEMRAGLVIQVMRATTEQVVLLVTVALAVLQVAQVLLVVLPT
jgi:hypothetical protein